MATTDYDLRYTTIDRFFAQRAKRMITAAPNDAIFSSLWKSSEGEA